MFFLEPEGRSNRHAENIDLIQLERKIENGELKQLTLRERELIAVDRNGREYRTEIKNAPTQSEILSQARELDAHGQPRVAAIVKRRQIHQFQRGFRRLLWFYWRSYPDDLFDHGADAFVYHSGGQKWSAR